jgi:hypothetical protein
MDSGKSGNPLKTWQMEPYRHPLPTFGAIFKPGQMPENKLFISVFWVLNPENHFGNQKT